MLFKKKNIESASLAFDETKKPSVIKILGSGCKKCNDLEKNVREALKKLGWEVEIVHVSDFAEISAYGVMTTPALVIDEKLVSYGKVLKEAEILQYFQ